MVSGTARVIHYRNYFQTLRILSRHRPYCLARPQGERDLFSLVRRFAADQSGATAIEYGLIAGLISVAIITAVRRIGTNLTTKFDAIANNLT